MQNKNIIEQQQQKKIPTNNAKRFCNGNEIDSILPFGNVRSTAEVCAHRALGGWCRGADSRRLLRRILRRCMMRERQRERRSAKTGWAHLHELLDNRVERFAEVLMRMPLRELGTRLCAPKKRRTK